MIEMPEAKVLAEQLKEAYGGKTIVDVSANQSPHGFAFYWGDPKEYPARLTGRTVTDAFSQGGHVTVLAEDGYLDFFDGVNMRCLTPEEKLPKKHQLLVRFDDDSHLVCTISMYGGLMANNEGFESNGYYAIAGKLPSPLTDDFNEAYFDTMWANAKENLSAKAFLATEQRIPGLGNGVLQDILFLAKVHPRTKLMKLDDNARGRIYASVKETLWKMTLGGGRDTEKDLYGCPGGYKTLLSRKTLADPCPVCGAKLVREAYLGGNVYYCPICQPLIK